MKQNERRRSRFNENATFKSDFVCQANFKQALVGYSRDENKSYNDLWPELGKFGHSNKTNSKNFNVQKKEEIQSFHEVPEEGHEIQMSPGISVVDQSSKDNSFFNEFPALGNSVDKKKHSVKTSIELPLDEPNDTTGNSETDAPSIVETKCHYPCLKSSNEGQLKGTNRQISKNIVGNKQLKHNHTIKKPHRNEMKINMFGVIQIAGFKKVKRRLTNKKSPAQCLLLGNRLDADKPIRKKGKERERPKKKNLSKIKKSIVLSRAYQTFNDIEDISFRTMLEEDLIQCTEDLSRLLLKRKDKSKIFEEKPTNSKSTFVEKEVKLSIHSRKFRTYCSNMPTKELIEHIKSLITSLRAFQDRLHQQDPEKAKRKKRYICGFKEVIKFIHCKDLKLCIVATNLEARKDDPMEKMILDIKKMCDDSNIPIAFAGTSLELGHWTMKRNRISIIGILNYQGCEDVFKCITDCLKNAQQQYEEMVHETKEELKLNDKEKEFEETIRASMLAKLFSKE